MFCYLYINVYVYTYTYTIVNEPRTPLQLTADLQFHCKTFHLLLVNYGCAPNIVIKYRKMYLHTFLFLHDELQFDFYIRPYE